VINREPIPLRTRSRGRRWLIIIGVLLLVLLLMLRSIATFWTDFLWFDSVDQTGVWTTVLFARVGLVAVATLVAFLLFYGNLWLADRLSPRRPAIAGSPDEELLERYQSWIAPRVWWMRLVAAGFFGLMIGLGAAVWWREFLQYRNGVPFGVTDPIFHNDIGLYVFSLPFYRVLFGWAFQLLLVVTLVTAAVHYLNGGIQVQLQRKVNPGVKVHLSVLLALLALLKAVGYVLDRWELLYSARGQVFGASYTDVKAQLPALNLLILISVVAAVILLVNLRFRGWTLPLVAVGLWLLTSIVVGGLYPLLVQRFRVVPDEINKEAEYVGYNIEYTRAAYGLTDVDVQEFAASPDLESADLVANKSTIDNIRLWDPSVLNTTYRQLQEIRTFYGIEDVDVDRYVVDGELTQVMVSARELDENSIPGGGWVNERLVYTHGFGAVVSPANAVTVEGQPDFLVKDIPPVSLAPILDITQPRIYFGDSAQSDYLIVKSAEKEVDYPIGEGEENVAYTTYDGSGGVTLGGLARRAAWALRFADVDMLISGNLSGDSIVLMERNIRDRVLKIAPFLETDSDPYLVVADGRLEWVLDMYTVSNNYPYSQEATTSRLNAGPGLPDSFNYIRNSVKAVVDAYDGTMTLYVVDPSDPLIQVQQKIFPDVFTDGSEMSETLREHLRYPEDLFRVQSDMYQAYHITDPRQFFSLTDPWQIARDPSTLPTDLRADFIDADGNPFRPMLPYYLLMRLPDEQDLSFLIMQPFTPARRPNMVSFLIAKSGPDDYGHIIDYRFPAASAQDGPGQVGDLINQNTDISAQFTLLGQGGSQVIQGSMLVIPIQESLLYVQPIYIRANSGSADTTGIPEFKRVVVSFDGRIEMRETLDEALAAVFDGYTAPGEPSGGGGTPGNGGVEVPSQVADLVAQAQQALADADTALRSGDLGTYADKVAEAQNLIDEAQSIISSTTTTTP